jgi:hypothetical protein
MCVVWGLAWRADQKHFDQVAAAQCGEDVSDGNFGTRELRREHREAKMWPNCGLTSRFVKRETHDVRLYPCVCGVAPPGYQAPYSVWGRLVPPIRH